MSFNVPGRGLVSREEYEEWLRAEREAAIAIQRNASLALDEQRARIEQLEAALKPFADAVGGVRSRAHYRIVPLAWLKEAQVALSGKEGT